MKTIITDKLTRDYLQKLERQNYLATAVAVLIATFSLFWMLFHIGGQDIVAFFADVMHAVAALIGACFILITVYRARRGPLQITPRLQFAWLLISLGLLADSLGGWYFTYLEHSGEANPVPSPADIGFTLFYPCMFLGLLLMPRSLRFRARTALDALITTLSILGISWFFFIGPTLTALKHTEPFIDSTLLVTLSYPCWDMLLIFAIVLLIRQGAERILHSSLLLCGGGVLCLIWANTNYAYFTAMNTYTSGTAFIDTFWYVGSLLIGLSALYQYKTLVNRAYNVLMNPTQVAAQADNKMLDNHDQARRHFIFHQSTLIYLPLLCLVVLMLYSEITNNEDIALFLVILTTIVGIFITLRYLLATRENEILLQERERDRQEAEHLRLMKTDRTNILEIDHLFERIVTGATSQLGFDAAILIIIDDYSQPLDMQTRLQVRAATSISSEVISWRLQGTELVQCTIVLGHDREIVWTEEAKYLPPEMESWRREQNIRFTLFTPIIYQGKKLGSLGFARRTEEHFNQHEIALAKAYTEQVATIIERVHLYQTTWEQEAFAKAMANIATRLNSAVVEPAEIHQLICTEAANALRADYVLLYGLSASEQLVPLATFISEQEPQALLTDWPPILLHEYEGQALTSLQPVLMPLYTQFKQANYKALALPGSHVRQKSSSSLPAYIPAQEIDGYPTSLLQKKLVRRHAHTAVLAPLIAGGDPFGLLVLARSISPGSHDKKSFDRTYLSYAQDFAEQAAVALTNAQLYQRLRTAHSRLQELDQLKDQFMITASHELRTPLTAVQGYIELMAHYDELLTTEQRQEFLEKAQRSCEELVVLLHNVMDASRLEIEAGIRSTHTERVRVWEVIDSVINLIEPHLKQEQREVHVSIPAHVCVQADAARLRQVLVNLSVNALKYSPPMTPLLYSAHAIFDQHGYVIISVTDKGKGIALQDQTRLFERFVRLESDLNSPIRGSGLGLYISRCLVEAMDGKIWIESSGIPGEGSTFHVQLPMAQA